MQDSEFGYMRHIGTHASDHQNIEGLRKGLVHGRQLLAKSWAVFAAVILVDILFVYMMRDIIPHINWIIFAILCLQALVIGAITTQMLNLFARIKRMMQHLESKRQ